MSATAPHAIHPSHADTRDPASPEAATILAMVEQPEDANALAAFLEALDRIDPAAPRSGGLTRALIAVLSLPRGDVWTAESFALRSLRSEIATSLAAGEDRFSLPPATLSLLIAVLHHRRICCLFLEDVLIGLRKTLLAFAQDGETPAAEQILLAEAMARHSFLTEYIWDVGPEEEAQVTALTDKVSGRIDTGAAVSAFELFLIGAYRPLDAIAAVRRWVGELATRDPGGLDPSLRLLVFDRLIEDGIAIDALTPVTSEVSRAVQSQYEENPYPRWRHMPAAVTFSDTQNYVTASIGSHRALSTVTAQRPRILVAGAGTGAHPISLARTLPQAAVLAIDLSRASLAYATREAAAHGVANIAFAQADILRLSGVDIAFDMIESVGVLHHMEEPEAGLQSLLSVLKPGGYLRLGLYSKAARHAVNAARHRFAETGIAPGLGGIRALRRDLIDTDDPALVPLRGIRDFFAASEFRDLVMHVQEHQYTVPKIGAMLRRNGLKFLGFSSPAARAVLADMPPKMAARRVRDLAWWDNYERRNPDSFICMYDFFCVKR